jgi:hypothetical protein
MHLIMHPRNASMNERTPPVLPDNFEKYGEADKQRRHRIRVLQHGGSTHRQLAEKLGECRKGHRCDSGACPICVGRFRRWLYGESLPIFVSRPNWTRASIIGGGMSVPRGQLHTFDLRALRKRIAKRLERSSLRNRIVFLGIDVSLNLRDNVIVGWQLHIYLLVEGQNTSRVQETLKAVFRPEPTAKIPYRFSCVTDPGSAITYAYKSSFVRHSQYRTPDGKAQTRNQDLKGGALRELLVFLHKYPIGSRLILRGLRRDGKHLIPTRPK